MSHLDVLKTVFGHMARGDVVAAVAHYTPDYVLELPYPVSRGALKVEGRDSVRDYLIAAFQTVRFALEIEIVHPTSDPDLVIAEYHGRGQALPTGKPYNNRYVGFWWFRGDAICRTREYYDQGVATEALTP